MNTRLSVPKLVEAPHLTVETRPKQVQEWLDAMPLTNVTESARKIGDALAAVNRTKVAEDTRLKLMESYRATILNLLPALQQIYAGKPLPLSDKGKQAVNLSRQLLSEVANGYKIILMDSINRRLGFGGSKHFPLVIHHAMDALSRTLVVSYESYMPTFAGIWSEMHQLYRIAAQNNLQETDVPDTVPKETINQLYKRTLLLALADPYHLMLGELVLVEDYLSRFCHQAQLLPLAHAENTAALFLVQLDTDKPPKALAHCTGVTDARSDILLNTIQLARTVHQQLLGLEKGEAPKYFNLPDKTNEHGYQDLMKRLLKHWGVAPKRVFQRTPAKEAIDVLGSIRSIHKVLADERELVPDLLLEPEENDTTLEVNVSPIDASTHQTYIPMLWVSVNESPGGLKLSRSGDAPSHLRVGELVGLKVREGAEWNIAVIRWIHGDAHNHIEMGAQMLSPHVKPVMIRPTITEQGAPFEYGLLLPEIPALKRPEMIAAPRGTYGENREYLLRQASELTTVRATKLMEHTGSFELFLFVPS